MLKDLSGNKITLADTPNGHSLILGRSGVGKTFYICRKMEEYVSKEKKILILDYSSSYTLSELQSHFALRL